MKLHKHFLDQSTHLSVLLLIIGGFVSGCSGSSESAVSHTQTSSESAASGANNSNEVAGTGSELATMADTNQSNAVALIRQAFEVITARAFDQRLFNSSPVDPASSGLTLVEALNTDTLVQTRRYSCSNGGMIEEIVTIYDSRAYQTQYDNCQIGGNTINGRSSHSSPDVTGNYSYLFDNYRVSFEPGGRMEVDGSLVKIAASSRSSGIVARNDVKSTLQYYFEYPEGTLSVSMNDSDYQYLLADRCCSIEEATTFRNLAESSSFEMRPPFSDNIFRITVLSEMSKHHDEPGVYFNTGKIKITSMGDESHLILDAASGHPDTVRLTVENSTTDYPWSIWSSVFCTKLSQIELGQECQPGTL